MRLDILKKAVDKKFGLDIATRSRKRKYVYPRKVFCKLARDTRVTFREMALAGKIPGVKKGSW